MNEMACYDLIEDNVITNCAYLTFACFMLCFDRE